ncbi:MAG: major capsid protein [Rhodocyclaceae bacterium]|nr:major capsid protein [Rhodocyclaceae bacterium]
MKQYLKLNWQPLLALTLIAVACMAGLVPHESVAAGGLLLGTVAPFPVTPQLTAVAIGYRNPALIADEVLPRVPVPLQSFKYTKYPKGTFFTIPETLVGRKGEPNTVEFTGEEVTDSTQDHALDDPVPNADIELARAQGMADPQMRAVEGITELLLLAREVRAANLVLDAAQYHADNKVTLAGNDQWSAAHADSDPIADIMTGLDACIMRPNVMVMGNAVSSKLRRHPAILKAYNGTSGDAGIVPLQFLSELFELEQILVGQGWINTAKKGKAPVMERVWGKSAALIYRNRSADARGGTTFGFTAQWGTRIGGSEYSSKIGMRGGQIVRAGESVKELITANDLGYLIANAVA